MLLRHVALHFGTLIQHSQAQIDLRERENTFPLVRTCPTSLAIRSAMTCSTRERVILFDRFSGWPIYQDFGARPNDKLRVANQSAMLLRTSGDSPRAMLADV